MPRLYHLVLLAACQCEVPIEETEHVDSGSPAEEEGCADPQDILTEAGTATGYVRCADGSVNRVSQVPITLDGTYAAEIPPCDPAWDGSCTIDDECVAEASGHCYLGGGTYFTPFCDCTYLCSSDADCRFDEVCLAPEVHELSRLRWPICVKAQCKTNDGCTSGECGVVNINDCDFGMAKLVCRQESDECDSNADCEPGASSGNCWSYGGPLTCCKDACD